MFQVHRELEGAAARLRSLQTSLAGSVDQLCSPHVWCGPDADRFERDWREVVTSPLGRAALKIDVVGFTHVTEQKKGGHGV